MWEDDAEEDTPRTNTAKHLLQPTVEDYYSELNLMATPSLSARGPFNSARDAAPVNKIGRQSMGRASSPTLSPEHTPAQLRRTAPPAHNSNSPSLAQQIQNLANCLPLSVYLL